MLMTLETMGKSGESDDVLLKSYRRKGGYPRSFQFGEMNTTASLLIFLADNIAQF